MVWKVNWATPLRLPAAWRTSSLERNVAGRIALIFLLSGLVALVLARALAMRRFQHLERGDLVACTRQVFLALDRETASLHPLISLYAEGGDLTGDLLAPRPDSLDRLFGGNWAEANDLDFVLIIGPDGRRVWSSAGFGRFARRLPDAFAAERFGRDNIALYRTDDGRRSVEWVAGLVGQAGKVWIYCAHAITGEGPDLHARGLLVYGRRIDQRRMPAFDPDSGPVLSMVDRPPALGPREAPVGAADWQSQVAGRIRSELRREGRSLVSYSPLADIFGQPLVVMRLAVPRRDEATGQRMLHIVELVGLVSFLAALALVVQIVRRTVVVPVRWLAWAFSGQGREREILAVLGSRHRDEIGTLANRAADLLAKIQEQHAALEHQATTDRLTGLANRRLMETHFQLEARRLLRRRMHDGVHARVALVMADVDHFKRYNDTYGHMAGDQCLKAVADALHACAARPGDLACRFGGEEFVLLLPDTDRAGALTVAEAARAAVVRAALPHRASPVAEVVTVSLGVADADVTESLTLEALLEAADRALYAAKNRGRNQAAVDPGGPQGEPGPVPVASSSS
jgi:diguanylate cyclase (GGDEF)-like protein